jgi:hypothetical protein
VLFLPRTDQDTKLHPLEIGALGDGEALEVAAQAVEAELDDIEARPVAAAIDTRAAGSDALLGSDLKVDAAAEIDAVGAVMACAVLARAIRSAAGADRTWIGWRASDLNKLSKFGARYRRSAQRGLPFQSENDAP